MATKISSLQLTSAGMPNDDFRASVWLGNFAEQLPGLRESLGVSQEQCDRVGSLVKAFLDAYEIASDKYNCTSPQIAAKTEARNEAVRAVREVFNAINANPDIDDVMRCTLGMPRRARAKKKPAQRKPMREVLNERMAAAQASIARR